MSDLITLVGFASSGKSEAANHLHGLGYRQFAFADAVKDCLSAIFGWDREALQGVTPKSRAWRDRVDPWWAERLGIPDLSPRWAMQNYGTDVMRDHFHPEIWIASLERKIDAFAGDNIVITDARFPNEHSAMIERGSRVYRIKRGPEPEWFDDAVTANMTDCDKAILRMHDRNVHASEWAWIGVPLDGTIENDGSLRDLFAKVSGIAK